MSDSFTSRASKFVSEHKLAVALASALAVAGAGTLAYQAYASSPAVPSEGEASSAAHKKKKKSKKKAKKTGSSNSEETSSGSAGSDLPAFEAVNAEFVQGLTGEQKSKYGVLYKEKGNQEFAKKHYKEAIQYYETCLKFAEDPVFYSNMSACYNGLGDYEKVVEYATKALKLKPDYTKCYSRRGAAFEQLEKYPEALMDLTCAIVYDNFRDNTINIAMERVLKKHSTRIYEEKYKNKLKALPSISTLCAFFDSFRSVVLPDDIKPGSDKIEDGSSLRGLLQQGFASLTGQQDSDYQNADRLFAEAYKSLGPLEEVSEEDKPYYALALEYSAVFKFLKFDIEGFRSDIAESIKLFPTVHAYTVRAVVNRELNNLVAAKVDFDVALKMDPKNGDVYYHLAQTLFVSDNLDEAKKNFEKAIELDEEFVFSYIQLAVIHYKKGDKKAAVEQFQNTIAKFPRSPEALSFFAEIQLDQGDVAAAQANWDKAYELQKKIGKPGVGVLPLLSKATCELQINSNIPKAKELLEEAARIDSRNDMVLTQLAQVELQMGDVQHAIELFEKVAEYARTEEEMIQAISFAEASKTQMQMKKDEALQKHLQHLMESSAFTPQ